MRGSAPHPVVKKGCFNMCFLAPPVAGAIIRLEAGIQLIAGIKKTEIWRTHTVS